MYKLLCGRYRNELVIALAFKIIALDLSKKLERAEEEGTNEVKYRQWWEAEKKYKE